MAEAIRHMPSTLVAFDLETAPDPYSIDMLAGCKEGFSRNVALHRISAAAWLVMIEQPDGKWRVDELDSLGTPTDEFDILLTLNRVLQIAVDRNGELVTYNGVRHDLPVLRRRATRHWMFELDGIFPARPINHSDVMRSAGLSIGSWPKLREACAGLGFTCDAEQDPLGSGRTLIPRRRKAEVDTVATMILRLHDLAAERRNAATLAQGWFALAEFIKRQGAARPHLVQFTTSPDLEAAVNRFVRPKG